jgi:hypothetical protein
MTPKPGMPVQVRSRSQQRRAAMARVIDVGTQMEAITPTLLTSASGGMPRPENGLPVLVSLPPDLKLMPGEIVDLIIRGDGK